MNYRRLATPLSVTGHSALLNTVLDVGLPTTSLIRQAGAFVVRHWNPKAAPLSEENKGLIGVASRLMMSIDMSWETCPVLNKTMTELTHVWHEMRDFDEVYAALSGKPVVVPEMQRKIAQHVVRVGSMLLATKNSPEVVAFFREIFPFFLMKQLSPQIQSTYERMASVGIVRYKQDLWTSASQLLPKTSVLKYFLERSRDPVMPKERIRMVLNRDPISENQTLFMALISDALAAQMSLTSFECAAVAEVSRCTDTPVADQAKRLMARRPGSFSPYLSPNEFLGYIDTMTDTEKRADALCAMFALCSLDVCKWHLNHLLEVNIGYLDVVIERLFDSGTANPPYDKQAALQLLMAVGQTVPRIFDRMSGVADSCLHQSQWKMASDIFVRMMTLPMSYTQNRKFEALASRIPDAHRVVVLLEALFSQETKQQSVKSLLKLPGFSEEALSLLRQKKNWEDLPFARDLFIGVQSLYRENEPETHVRMVSILATLLIRRDSENRLVTSPMGAYISEPLKEALAQLLSDTSHSHHREGWAALKQAFPKKH